MKNWTDVYKLPLKKLPYYLEVFDANDQWVFSFDEEVSEKASVIALNVINGKEASFIFKECTYRIKDQTILADGKVIIDIRGYGYLTGIGGLNLPHKEAANIQDEFAQFIIDKFNGN